MEIFNRNYTGNEYKFIPNIWIKFELNNLVCIGRTFDSLDDEYNVLFIDENGNIGKTHFDKLFKPVKLHFKSVAQNNINIIDDEFVKNFLQKTKQTNQTTQKYDVIKLSNKNKKISNNLLITIFNNNL